MGHRLLLMERRFVFPQQRPLRVCRPRSQVVAAECRIIGGEAWWQFILHAAKPIFSPPRQFGPPLTVQPIPVYVHAESGKIGGEEIDHQYAGEIAEQVFGESAEIHQQLTGFSPTYAVIHRLRPVYQMSPLDDPSQHVYVSTHHGSAPSWANMRRRIDRSL